MNLSLSHPGAMHNLPPLPIVNPSNAPSALRSFHIPEPSYSPPPPPPPIRFHPTNTVRTEIIPLFWTYYQILNEERRIRSFYQNLNRTNVQDTWNETTPLSRMNTYPPGWESDGSRYLRLNNSLINGRTLSMPQRALLTNFILQCLRATSRNPPSGYPRVPEEESIHWMYDMLLYEIEHFYTRTFSLQNTLDRIRRDHVLLPPRWELNNRNLPEPDTGATPMTAEEKADLANRIYIYSDNIDDLAQQELASIGGSRRIRKKTNKSKHSHRRTNRNKK